MFAPTELALLKRFLLIGAAMALMSVAPMQSLGADAADKVDFAKDIQPLLAKSCYECHGPEKQKGGLRLDDRTSAFKGGDTGPLFVAGKSSSSLLVQAVLGTKEDLARMPKKKDPLSGQQIDLLK